MPKKVKPISIKTKAHYYDRINKEDKEVPIEDTVEILSFEDVPVAESTVYLGATKQIKEFESVRVDCSVKVPHYVEETENALIFAQEKAASSVKSCMNDIFEYMKRKNSELLRKE